jgi:Protein kinase domain
MEQTTIEHWYEINAFGDTICKDCGQKVAIHNKKTGKFSINDIPRHENRKESHRKTRDEDRQPIVDELERNWEELSEEITLKRKRSDQEAMDMLKTRFLGKLQRYKVCGDCTSMVFNHRSHRCNGRSYPTFIGSQNGFPINGWTKNGPLIIPEASLSFDESEEKPSVLCRSLRRHLAAAAKKEMTSNNDPDFVAERTARQTSIIALLHESQDIGANGSSVIEYDPNNYFDFDSFEKGTEWSKDDFVWLKNLGEGGYGSVDLCIERSRNGLLALKTVERNDLVQTEIMIQRRFNHKNIVRLYDFFEDGDNTVLMLEYCSSRSLHDVLKKLVEEDRNLTEESVVHTLLEIVEALTECHSEGVMHCDIKPENILIGKKGEMKLADFGLSFFKLTDRPLNYPAGGTADYMSPEMLNAHLTDDDAFNETTDIWSLGILLFVLLTKEYPFLGDTKREVYSSIINDLGEDGTFEFPSSVSEGAKHLIMEMLLIEPKLRISLEEVKNHFWIQDVINRPFYKSSYERS